jgi:predicted RNA-binding protein associated with RNAse of E/G family
MKLDELLVVMQNRLLTLEAARKAAVIAGDIERVIQLDGDLFTTTTSIEQLKRTIAQGHLST